MKLDRHSVIPVPALLLATLVITGSRDAKYITSHYSLDCREGKGVSTFHDFHDLK